MDTVSGSTNRQHPAIGIGFRLPIAPWIEENLNKFDVLEITVDHYIHGGEVARKTLRDLVGRVPLIAHGVGLSIGTDTPLDEQYLAKVGETLDDLKMPSYSEHLAWTKAPGIDLANLLPLPRTREVADLVIEKIHFIKSFLGVPFALENISYVFEFADSEMTEQDFITTILGESGATMLLDVENLFVNSKNHRFSATAFLDALPSGIVTDLHLAGGPQVSRHYLDKPVLVDAHNEKIPDGVMNLLDEVLERFTPGTAVIERDDDEDLITQELDEDTSRLRAFFEERNRLSA